MQRYGPDWRWKVYGEIAWAWGSCSADRSWCVCGDAAQFINLASSSELRVGESLMSCTDKIELSRPFPLDNYLVTLVDTPGFDDTTKSDADVLNIVSDYLASE